MLNVKNQNDFQSTTYYGVYKKIKYLYTVSRCLFRPLNNPIHRILWTKFLEPNQSYIFLFFIAA